MKTEIKAALEKGEKIGALVWYSCEKAAITPSKLRQLFDQHSMRKAKDKDGNDYFVDFPEDIKEKNAFQKACRLAMTRQNSDEGGNTTDNRRSVVKLIVDGKDHIAYGVVDLNVESVGENIDPDYSAKVWMEKGSGTVKFDKDHPLVDRIVAMFNELQQTYTSRDISRITVNALERMHCVSLRPGGGVYFIPVQSSDDLSALQNVINAIGACRMDVFTIGNDNGNTGSLATSVKSHINDKIEEMKADLADFRESLVNQSLKGKSANNSLEVRVRRYNELKLKCQVMADALKVKADSLLGDLDDVGKALSTDLRSLVLAA